MFCGVFLKIEGGIQHWRERLFINMDFKIRRRDGNENVKKKKEYVWKAKQQLCTSKTSDDEIYFSFWTWIGILGIQLQEG